MEEMGDVGWMRDEATGGENRGRRERGSGEGGGEHGGGGGVERGDGRYGKNEGKVRAGENRGRRERGRWGEGVGRGEMNLPNFTVLSGAHSPQGECTITRRIREINNKGSMRPSDYGSGSRGLSVRILVGRRKYVA